jgi:hypothetical protein
MPQAASLHINYFWKEFENWLDKEKQEVDENKT